MMKNKQNQSVWSQENLKVTEFQNGDSIPLVTSAKDWKKASENRSAACCYPGYNPENGEKYGLIYNGYAILDERGICPEGLRIPTEVELRELIAAGMQLELDLPKVGLCNGSTGYFNNRDLVGYYWSSSIESVKDEDAIQKNKERESRRSGYIRRGLGIPDELRVELDMPETKQYLKRLYFTGSAANIHGFELGNGHSVRCIQI
ncbi:MAG: hypothetical protein DA443_09765 [Bacteroidetes bacterium]|nr:MAG: hypothetical protein DA443_09765 [Bacteroidota bacterium]